MTLFSISSFTPYTPSNWYWIVGQSITDVWSSARAQYVPQTDSVYVEWLGAGNIPTPISTEDALQIVLADAYPAGWPSSLPQQAAALILGGLSITSNSTPSLNAVYSASPNTITYVNSEVVSILLNGTFTGGSSTLQWADITGTLHTFPSTDSFKAFATVLGAFVNGAIQVEIGASTTLPSNSVTIP